MKDLRLFLEHRTVDTIKIIDKYTKKELNPTDMVFDESTLDELENKIRKTTLKRFVEDYKIYISIKKGNTWLVDVDQWWILNPDREDDYLVCVNEITKDPYSYDEIINKFNHDDFAIITLKLDKQEKKHIDYGSISHGQKSPIKY